MEINTGTFGTKGLPKFGAETGAIVNPAPGSIGELDAAFNTLINVTKKYAVPGNELALWFFGMTAKSLHAAAVYCITGKPVING